MNKKGNKEDDKYLAYCFKYHICKLCPRNAKCEKEEQKENKKLIKRK